MKLLTVGQSLREVHDEPNPYKITEQHLLPKFAAVGRPVALAPPKERFTRPIQIRSDFQAVKVSQAAIRAVSTASAAKAVKAAVANEGKHPVPGMATRQGWRAFFSLAARTKPRTRRPWVQGEMTLDTVRVIRNDLNEADLEVVPAKMEAKPEPASPAVVQPAEGSAWSRAAARLAAVARSWRQA